MSSMNWVSATFSWRAVVSLGLALLVAGCGAEDWTDAASDAVIFEVDGRQDFGAMSSHDQGLAAAVAIHVHSDGLSCAGGTCSLKTTPFTTEPNLPDRLCRDVRFRGQKLATRVECTAWLVAPDLLATAGHCYDGMEFTCETARYVFGFNAAANGRSEVTSFSSSDVYSCSSILTLAYEGSDATAKDYAVVKLDRTVVDRTPLIVRHGEPISDPAPLFVFGHPSGLPIKVSLDATLRDNSYVERFYFNGDVFGGNSGGPVLNLRTDVVEGITVTQPNPRFVSSSDAFGTCRAYRVCPDSGCSDRNIVDQLTGATRMNRVPDVPLHAALVTVVL
jgi:V8-like Glu-specific endopeptidase